MPDKKPFYLNPWLWAAVVLVLLILVFAAFSIVYGIKETIKGLFEPATYISIGLLAAAVGGAALGIAGAWGKVKDGLKEIRDRSVIAEAKAVEAEVKAIAADSRADKAETKADKAETKANVAETKANVAESRADAVAGQVEDNRAQLVQNKTDIEMIKVVQTGQQSLIDSLQEERAESQKKIAKMENVIEAQALAIANGLGVIGDLRQQIAVMLEITKSDKEIITRLQARLDTCEVELEEIKKTNNLLHKNRVALDEAKIELHEAKLDIAEIKEAVSTERLVELSAEIIEKTK